LLIGYTLNKCIFNGAKPCKFQNGVTRWPSGFPLRWCQALDLKEGEEIDIHLAGARVFEVSRKPGTKELLARLHEFRGRFAG
jgi:predicted DNA-binding antitoxin AbrB/MazE fold protein